MLESIFGPIPFLLHINATLSGPLVQRGDLDGSDFP